MEAGDEMTIFPMQVDMSNPSVELSTDGNTITVGENGVTISEIPLSQQRYWYVYAVIDIFDNMFLSSIAIFEMQYSYEELLENPLPDGEYAAKVVTIIGDD